MLAGIRSRDRWTHTLFPYCIKQMVTEAGIDNLSKPQNYFAVDAIPKLGSGKTDYAAAKALALSLIE